MDLNQKTSPTAPYECCAQEMPKECTGACAQLEKELAVCKEGANEWKDKFLRLTADFENYKRRAEKERANWVSSAQAEMLRQLLPIADTVDRALADAHKTAQTPEMKIWLAGFAMIGDALHKFLRSNEVTEITDTAAFDPQFHEAIVSVQAEGKAAGDIVAVLEKGYLFKGELLRPAKVSVAK